MKKNMESQKSNVIQLIDAINMYNTLGVKDSEKEMYFTVYLLKSLFGISVNMGILHEFYFILLDKLFGKGNIELKINTSVREFDKCNENSDLFELSEKEHVLNRFVITNNVNDKLEFISYTDIDGEIKLCDFSYNNGKKEVFGDIFKNRINMIEDFGKCYVEKKITYDDIGLEEQVDYKIVMGFAWYSKMCTNIVIRRSENSSKEAVVSKFVTSGEEIHNFCDAVVRISNNYLSELKILGNPFFFGIEKGLNGNLPVFESLYEGYKNIDNNISLTPKR